MFNYQHSVTRAHQATVCEFTAQAILVNVESERKEIFYFKLVDGPRAGKIYTCLIQNKDMYPSGEHDTRLLCSILGIDSISLMFEDLCFSHVINRRYNVKYRLSYTTFDMPIFTLLDVVIRAD